MKGISFETRMKNKNLVQYGFPYFENLNTYNVKTYHTQKINREIQKEIKDFGLSEE